MGAGKTGRPYRRAILRRFSAHDVATLAAMPAQKVSVTLEADPIEEARRVAGPRGLSSYMDAALAEKLERDARRRSFLAYLDELDAADPLAPEVRRRAEAQAERIRQAVKR